MILALPKNPSRDSDFEDGGRDRIYHLHPFIKRWRVHFSVLSIALKIIVSSPSLLWYYSTFGIKGLDLLNNYAFAFLPLTENILLDWQTCNDAIFGAECFWTYLLLFLSSPGSWGNDGCDLNCSSCVSLCAHPLGNQCIQRTERWCLDKRSWLSG